MTTTQIEEKIVDYKFRRLVETCSIAAIATVLLLAYLFEGSLTATLLIAFGFALAMIDTAFGMGYGTLATPVLLIAGFQAIAIVPAVLLSQAIAAAFATGLHVKYKNVDLFDLKGSDARISAAVIIIGIIGVAAAVTLAIKLPSLYVKTYIGALVVAMGLLLLAKPRFGFSWSKVYAISLVNGFDKGISGGGFGPVAVGGLLSLGHRIRNSVGIAVFTAFVTNIAGVLLYFLFHTIVSNELFLIGSLSAGAVIGSLVGPGITGRLNGRKHLSGLAYAIIVIGALSLLTTLARP